MEQKHIDAVRAFNRFYTDIIGLLDGYILNSRYTLPEVRIMFELYHHENITASDIISFLMIDKGYLSRILLQFENKKLITKKRSAADARAAHISLTAKGKKEFEVLNQASHDQVRKLLEKLSVKDRINLLGHMSAITRILGGSMKNANTDQEYRTLRRSPTDRMIKWDTNL